ncbi:MAG: YfhO family protein [bacterium]|nr:YfhO family protein [bacterium]
MRFLAVLVPLAALAALIVGRPLFDAERVAFPVDGATTQLPWSKVIAGAPGEARDPGSSDLGVAFYPAYRHVAQRLAAGDLPLWNGDVHAGVPLLANPQWGVLDPFVWGLALAERRGGKELFDRALGWLAALRIVIAGLGAWCLARALGAAAAGAGLAAVGFALSGAFLPWLHFSVGHSAPWLPWVLLGVEGCAGARPRRSALGCALALWLAIVGGHPETAFFVGLAAGARALTLRVGRGRALGALAAGTLLAGVLLVPFGEYLAHSGAWLAHQARSGGGLAAVDYAALGAFAMICGACVHARRVLAGARDGVALHVAAAAALAVAVWILRGRGLRETAGVSVVFDLFGRPLDAERYTGPGAYIEAASAWVATPVLALALAAVLELRGSTRALRSWSLLGAFAFALAVGFPGIVELWRALPLVGGAATERAAPVAALAAALLAGDGLQRARTPARVAGVCLCGALVLLAFRAPPSTGPAVDSFAAEVDGTLYGLDQQLPETVATGRIPVAGWLHAAVPVRTAALRCDRLGVPGPPLHVPVLHVPVRIERGAPGERARFTAPHFDASLLAAGAWAVTLELFDEAGPLGKRSLGAFRVERPRRGGPLSLGLVLLGLLGVAALALGSPRGMPWLIVALAAVQGLAFARGTLHDVARGEVFPETHTTAALRVEQADGRVLGGPGVLVYNTALAHGLRGLDGYDALDVASFDGYRAYAMHAGTNPLLDWNASGIDLDSPAFRLLGVRAIATARPLEHPDWELALEAETFLYRARDPLPRAFCVPRIVPREDVLADLAAFDPAAAAFLEEARDWVPASPFTAAEVTGVVFSYDEVRMRVTLDGDGLLVLTEQAFPGWRASVDGETAEVWTVDSMFRGVALTAGEHEVVFRYWPLSLIVGAWSSALGLCVLLGAVFGRSR